MAVLNSRYQDSALNQVAAFTDGAGGALKTMQVVQKTARLVNEVRKEAGFQYAPTLSTLDSKLGTAVSCLNLPRIPGACKSAISSLSALSTASATVTEANKKTLTAVKDSLDLVSTIGNAAALITVNPVIKTVTTLTDFAKDVTDLGLVSQDVYLVTEMQKKVENGTDEMKTAIDDTRNTLLLNLAKTVMSVTSGILGLFMLACGAPLLPSIALIVISLSSTVFGMASNFYETTRPYQKVNLYSA